ncbi:MAG: DUF2459 domain-containing protein [Bacteroidota bacterium]
MLKLFLIIALFSAVSCVNQGKIGNYAEKEAKNITIHVSKRSWHTNIILPVASVDSLLPELRDDFSDSEYFEISWGDEKYFMADEGTIGLALRAALFPTSSVVRVFGMERSGLEHGSDENFVSLNVTQNGLENMVKYIEESFEREDNGEFIRLTDNENGRMHFYLSSLSYWGHRTCNVWTARALKKAGVPVIPFYAIRASNLMKQVSKVEY